jgi:uncharacterized GH25 family protein
LEVIFMKWSFVPKKFLKIAGILAAIVVLWAIRSDAHSFIVRPVRSTVAVGETTDVWVTLSEPFALPDLSLYGYGATIDAQLVYAGGKQEPIVNFSFFSSKTPSDVDPAHSDVQKAVVSISEAGTVMLCAKMTMQMPKEVVPDEPNLVCFAKNAMNVIEDGAAGKPVGGNDVLEIVPTGNLNGLTAGEPFEVQVLFKGKPLAGATVSAAYDGLPVDEETGEQKYGVQVTANGNGVASVTPDRAAFWLLNAEHEVREDGALYQYQGTLMIPVNGKEGETERITTDLLMPAADNGAGLNFAEFVEGQLPEADSFLAENQLRWAAYLASGRGSSSFYTEGKNQLAGDSGVAFTIPVKNSEPDAFTAFSSVYVFTPQNIGEDAYKTLADELSTRTAEYGAMIVASPGELFPKLGLAIVQVYADGTERDVTGVMVDAGFETSKMAEGETAVYWGVLVADRAASSADNNIPVVLSSIGEDGHILFDGKRDGSIDGTFYIARASAPAGKSSGGCDAGLGIFALAGLASTVASRRIRSIIKAIE